MASFPNKVMAQVAFKAGGNIFHHLLADNPKHLAKATPLTIQACDLHQGNYGVNGSVIQWKYTLDGKPQIAKQVLENIDKEKKQISWKTVEGDMLELYKRITTTVHVETKSGVDFVTWTLDYELIDADKPHPLRVLNLLIELTKELEAYIFGSPEEAPVHTSRSHLFSSPKEVPAHPLYDQVLQVPTRPVRRKKIHSIRCIVKFFKFQLVLQIQFQL